MMRKKIIPICFILLSNIMVLGHTFIPHHHHHRSVCIIQSHCKDDNVSHNRTHTQPSHHHDGEQNNEICVFKLFFVVPTNHIKPEIKFLKWDSNIDHVFCFHALHQELNSTKSILGEKIPPIPLIAASDYLFDILNGIGLRAPPTV